MEKQGVINEENTPAEESPSKTAGQSCCGNKGCATAPLEDHLTKRAADVAAERPAQIANPD